MRAHIPTPDELPAQVPHHRDNAFRALCRWILRVAGWRLAGAFPDCPRLVLIAAPHSSWWDGVLGMLMKVGVGIDIAFIGKRELFRGPLGWLLLKLGGIPVDRHSPHGVAGQMVARFAEGGTLWFGLAPEGTRKPVKRWRSGFWHIASDAGVPILPVYFHYPEKIIGIGTLFQPTADKAADLAHLRAWYKPWQGLHHGV